MYRPDELGRRLRELRETKGLSAFAVARMAGLGMNAVRTFERGIRKPLVSSLLAVAKALELDRIEIDELKRLAGIDPDPGDSPEAKQARRVAWPLLAYVLANHVFLPRMELLREFSRKGKQALRVAEILRAAASARDLLEFYLSTDADHPPAGLMPLIEKHFGTLESEPLMGIIQNVRSIAHERSAPDRVGKSQFPEYTLAEPLLLAGRVPPSADWEYTDYIYNWGFGRSFAIAMFPALYWEACQVWPFEKIFMPLARREEASQRRLFDAIRAGLSLEDFDAALLGGGKLGADIMLTPYARLSPDISYALDDARFHDPALNTYKPHPPNPRKEPASCDLSASFLFSLDVSLFCGPVPPNDAIFDHLDRCEFLNRFPILKIDQAGASTLARSLPLRSWTVWVDHVRRYVKDLPANSAILDDRRFDEILSIDPIRVLRSESLIREWVSERFRQAVDSAMEDGLWKMLSVAGEALDIDDEIRIFVDSLAARQAGKVNP
jgi:transcriptional regulator with XRE-family HTH domain